MEAPQEMNHRQRKQCYMHSTIFDEQGPSPNSVYAPSRQHELYGKFSGTLGPANRQPPELVLPKPGDVKCTQMAGHNAVLPGREEKDPRSIFARTPGEEVVVYDGEARAVVHCAGKDHNTIPKEFWQTSTTLQWHDTRNEKCRNKNQGVDRTICAQDMKRIELSSELFGSTRLTEASTLDPRNELQADSADLLRMDSALHSHKQQQQQQQKPGSPDRPRGSAAEARMRMQKNLSSSNHNTMPVHEAAKEPPCLTQHGDDVGNMQRRRQEKNFSDLFGTQMGDRKEIRGQREEVLGTHGCSFLDTRGEIAQRNKDHWKQAEHDSPARRKGAQLDSSLFEYQRPEKPPIDPELEEVHRQERSCWDSKDAMHSVMENARRTRMKDHRKDFDDAEGQTDASRKQGSMASVQMRLSMTTDPMMHTTWEPSSPPPRAKGLSPSEREELLRSPKSTKLASLQSSIFS